MAATAPTRLEIKNALALAIWAGILQADIHWRIHRNEWGRWGVTWWRNDPADRTKVLSPGPVFIEYADLLKATGAHQAMGGRRVDF